MSDRGHRAPITPQDHLREEIVRPLDRQDFRPNQSIQGSKGTGYCQADSEGKAASGQIIRQDETTTRFGSCQASGLSGLDLLAEYSGPGLLGWREVDSIEPRPIHGWEQTQSYPLLQFRQDLFGSYQRRKGGAK